MLFAKQTIFNVYDNSLILNLELFSKNTYKNFIC